MRYPATVTIAVALIAGCAGGEDQSGLAFAKLACQEFMPATSSDDLQQAATVNTLALAPAKSAARWDAKWDPLVTDLQALSKRLAQEWLNPNRSKSTPISADVEALQAKVAAHCREVDG